MAHPAGVHFNLPDDIFYLIFDHFVGDSATLTCAGLVSRRWRILSLPYLLKDVDISSHNNNRVPGYENEPSIVTRQVLLSSCSDIHRPPSLVPRQRAFLRLMTERPQLTLHVRAFTWTLVWTKSREVRPTDISLRTWDVFERMQNVTRLDLASLHNISDQTYIRENPARLFPAVTHLRLVGWMHRGLVKAIVTSLDASSLRCLQLDHLQDEGALPNGKPIPLHLAVEHLPAAVDPYTDHGIDDILWARQERGEAGIFPGPMWYPLRLLRQQSLASMAHLEIRLGYFIDRVDRRNYITMFHETSQFIQSTNATLETISIGLGENSNLHDENDQNPPSEMPWGLSLRIYRPMCFDLTSAFLQCLLRTLSKEQFPYLTRVDLEGFRIIRNRVSQHPSAPPPDLIWQYIRDCEFVDEAFTEIANVDPCPPFCGYNYSLGDMDEEELDELQRLLGTS